LKENQRRYFESLDLVRGLAALVVLIYHVDFMFGLRHWLMHGGYLAVDLFFVLSGFVLSLTYGRSIADGSLGIRKYAVARIARLFPLFLATTCVGFVVMTARYRSIYGDFDPANSVKTALFNIFMMPSFVGMYNIKTSFPFNPASWSIFFELVASFLTGVTDRAATIVQVGQRRTLDIGIEIPRNDELSSVCSTPMWSDIFDQIADLTREHRSTLLFVNTRRMVERLCGELGARLGAENVAAHHGSLSRALRLDAEQRLKAGEIQCLVATASLELGIDIGAVDLVCQISSTRAVAVAMQRIGRAGHWRGAVPKGRFFATTRDDLMEQAALVQAMRSGELDKLEIPPQPLDVLMQQIVAACGAEPWEEDALYHLVRRAYPYRDLTRSEFEELIKLLHEGIESTRGRYGAYLLRDGIAGHLHPRRGARMIAIGNGGAIPDTAMYNVVLQPEGVTIATLDEHFAVDSGPGDVVQLGNASWRILGIEKEGRVLVEDAHGAPPTVPFWFGEAPQRTAELSSFVAELREGISERTRNVHHEQITCQQTDVASTVAWLMETCAIGESAALQLVQYILFRSCPVFKVYQYPVKPGHSNDLCRYGTTKIQPASM